MKRRGFLLASSVAGLGTGLALWLSRERKPEPPARSERMVDDPKGVLRLREGFRYRVLETMGQPMDDGFKVPGQPDAMGCFALPDGKWALMRNHELDASLFSRGPYHRHDKPPEHAYDARSVGGVSRVLLDAQGRRLRSNLVLVGTNRNCAGGMSPWGWLTCEESVDEGHGYVFLCATDASEVRPPRRIPAYGRFLHEAVAIDPETNTAYLTEDRGDGCFYRFVPRDAKDPFGKGRLEALAILDAPRFDLGGDLPPNKSFEVRWVEVPPEAGEREDALRYAAQERGAAVLRRGEGIWRMEDGFALTCTSGGPMSAGQIFHLAPTSAGGRLSLIVQSRDQGMLDMPDNITLTPWGDLMVCEDNHRAPYLRIVTRTGQVLPFAQNALSLSEFSGVCFSPDGRVMFVNIQEQGLTLAIEGPFEALGARA
jgi:secreted PhoX family phosphatase